VGCLSGLDRPQRCRHVRAPDDRRDHRCQPAHVRHDPHPDEPAVRGIFELGFRHPIDLVRGLGRRHLDQEGIDVLVGQGLAAHFARLAVLDHGHRLVRQEIELIPLFAQEHVDERINPRWHYASLKGRAYNT
jgi:hypothetical protein